MPISLPPIDRRSFLKGTLAGTASLGFSSFWAKPLFADDATSKDVWAFLADTHIPGDRNKTGGKPPCNPVDHFTKARTDILSGKAGKPGGVIVCGDCVYIEGLPKDYDTLLEEFNPLREARLSVHFVMGNHDNRKAFLEAAARADGVKSPSPVPDRLYTVIESPKANFFLLDSLERTNYTPGCLGEEQLQWLADELDRRKDKPAILVAHHYPDYTAGVAKNPHALTDTEPFFKVIKDRKQVKAYVFGHSHVWSRQRQHGIHLVNIPATGWRFDQTQPFAWVLMQLKDEGMNLTLRSIDPEHPKHDETVELAWR